MKKLHLTILIGLLSGASAAMGQSADQLLSEGREAFLDYRFDDAAHLYAQAKKKAKKADSFFNETYPEYHRQLTDAENFLQRVEKIAIIDSISVPREKFFKAYRLPISAGSLRGAEALPATADNSDGNINFVFSNEGDDYKLWAQPDTTGFIHLVESTLLTDGSWSRPSPISDELSEGCDAIYPFMMPDGVTLYYAENGENSIGGYDIMVATRDASDGTFLQPSNLGFPYNSPYDDYLLAIDELNGVGWWATDRNQLDDELTVYVFITNDLRTNYSPDDDNLISYARIDDYIATQAEEADYDDLLSTIRAIDTEARAKKPEFTLAAFKGKIYHRYEELPSAAAREAVKRYIQAENELTRAEADLTELRKNYYNSRSQSYANKIKQAEVQIVKTREDVKRLRSEAYKTIGK